MKRKIHIYFSILMVVSFCNGCAEALYVGAYAIEGAKALAIIASSSNKSSTSEQPASTLWRKKEELTIGKYNVNIVEGLSEQVPDIYFIAFYNGQVAKSLTFYRKNPDDMKMINGFNNLGEPEKKKQIAVWFKKYGNFDLDPIEPEQAQISKENTATKP